MKKLNIFFMAAALVFGATSCNDMDLEPKGLVYENVLLKSDNGIKKYLSVVYQDLPIEDFNYKQSGDDAKGYATVNQEGWHTGNKWQAQKGSPAAGACEALGRDPKYGEGWGYWPYDRIRDINNFIEALPEYKTFYSEEKYNEYLGEARFLRAFYYFGLVKRYGGVPIVDKKLDPKTPVDELQQPRDKEYDCWKFIHDDLEFAMANAAKTAEPGRTTRYAAAALMSRAMLYAGSIAKYGHYMGTTGPAVDAGLMGIPEENAAEFFQYSYDACKFIQQAGFKLHTGADKEVACVETFSKENKDEDIFIRQYGSKSNLAANTSLFHSWDAMVLPLGTNMATNVGAALQPVWEVAGLYQMPAIKDADDKPIHFAKPEELWNNGEMEARCRANIFFTGMTEPGSGTVLDMQGGVYKSYPGTVADGTFEEKGSVNAYTTQYRVRASKVGDRFQTIDNVKNVKVSGAHGMYEGTGDEGYSRTGMLIRKYTCYSGDISTRGDLFGSSQPWKVFRYGEILCNWAEAAYELGLLTNNEELKKEAFVHVNELRDRAGARQHNMVDSPEDVGSAVYGFPIDENLQYIRDERARELFLENQRLFDLRRWRVADVMFRDGHFGHTLLCYYVMDTNDYIFLNDVDSEGRKVEFQKKWYYEQIPGGEIGKNPKLIRNDGY